MTSKLDCQHTTYHWVCAHCGHVEDALSQDDKDKIIAKLNATIERQTRELARYGAVAKAIERVRR